jgi:hypothetical protein
VGGSGGSEALGAFAATPATALSCHFKAARKGAEVTVSLPSALDGPLRVLVLVAFFRTAQRFRVALVSSQGLTALSSHRPIPFWATPVSGLLSPVDFMSAFP